MSPGTRRARSGSMEGSAAPDAASAISIASAAAADTADTPPGHIAEQQRATNDNDDDVVLRERFDLRALDLLEQELLQVQTLKRDAQSEIELLLEEQKKLEVVERREKAESAKKKAQGSRLSRIQQLQEQERARTQQLQAEREQQERERAAKAEDARRRQAHSIQTRDDEDLDAFLAHESSYF